MNLRAILDNPAVFVGLMRALMILLTTFGVGITTDQQDGVLEAVGAFLALLSLVFTAATVQATTPTSAPVLPEGTNVHVTTPAGQPDRIVTV